MSSRVHCVAGVLTRTHRIATCARYENDKQEISPAKAQRRKEDPRASETLCAFFAPLRLCGRKSSQMTDTKRVAGVIVTHGQLAGELLAAAEMIVGPISHIAAVSIGWHDDVDAARDEVQ